MKAYCNTSTLIIFASAYTYKLHSEYLVNIRMFSTSARSLLRSFYAVNEVTLLPFRKYCVYSISKLFVTLIRLNNLISDLFIL